MALVEDAPILVDRVRHAGRGRPRRQGRPAPHRAGSGRRRFRAVRATVVWLLAHVGLVSAQRPEFSQPPFQSSSKPGNVTPGPDLEPGTASHRADAPSRRGPPPGATVLADTEIDLSLDAESFSAYSHRNLDLEIAPKFKRGWQTVVKPVVEMEWDWFEFDDPALTELFGDFDEELRQELSLMALRFEPSGWGFFGRVSAEAAYAPGVDPADAVSWLGLAAASWSPDRRNKYGLGLAVTRGLEDSLTAFPIPTLDLWFGDDWNLRTEKGVTVNHQLGARTQAGLTLTFDSNRFRLDEDAPVPSGVAEIKTVPLFLHVHHQATERLRLTAELGGVVWSEIEMDHADGRAHTKVDDIDPGWFAGLRARWRF